MRRALLAALAVLFAGAADAQNYPNRNVRVLEPLAAGSSVDVITRIVTDKMGQILHGSFYVDNQPGAAGLIGMRSGARATPDGYTILAVNDSVVSVLPNIRKDAQYDPRRDFVPIIELARLHWALVASPSLGADTVKGFIEKAKAKPGEINYASGGQGSPQHIAMELFMRATGIKLTHVPFRGATPALNEIVADHVPVGFTALPNPLPFLDDHRLTILGVADRERLPAVPKAPTIIEAGVAGFEFYAWGALLAPAKTPPDIIAKLHDAAAQALEDAEVKKRLVDLGYEVVGGTPEQLQALIAEDFQAKGKLLREADIHAD
jgi:tripartite-type tricarboxylate transporter receptor subunit TctC